MINTSNNGDVGGGSSSNNSNSFYFDTSNGNATGADNIYYPNPH
jgi:hypothetical protein